MMDGFFPESDAVTKQTPSLIAKCGACGLYRGCQTPKMKVFGEGRAGILVVGGAPEMVDDQTGRHFTSPEGRLLRASLENAGVDLDKDCWQTNALICRKADGKAPTAAEIDHCRPNLMKAIQTLKPRQIMLYGPAACSSLLGLLWREKIGSVARWAGWKIPLQEHNCWVTPNYDPADVLDSEGDTNGRVVRLWFDRYTRQAVELPRDRPWKTVPRYKDEIEILRDVRKAAECIRHWTEIGGVFAFDYETDRLKPDAKDSKIVCCSVCRNGTETISFPWAGAVIDAMRAFVSSDWQKIGANNKFESRWTKRHLGCDVKNFVWDTVQDAHVLDNREGITSVKFQAFVRLGFPDWSYSVKQFLEAPDGNATNRIHEVDLHSLLLYCGIDSLVEYKLAVLQKQELQQYRTE